VDLNVKEGDLVATPGAPAGGDQLATVAARADL